MRYSLSILIFCCLFACTLEARAEDEVALEAALSAKRDFSLGLGLSSSVMPYKNYATQWDPRLLINFESSYFYVSGFEAGVYLFKGEVLTLSADLRYNDFCFSPSDSSDAKIRRLKKRRSSLLGGLELGVLTPMGLFQAGGAWDLLGRSAGFDGGLSWTGLLEAGRLKLFPALGLTWQSSQYLNYYYGVERQEAAQSGLEAYQAASGWSPYAELACDLKLSATWDFLLLLEVEGFGRAIRNSPMVNKNAAFNATAGLLYTF